MSDLISFFPLPPSSGAKSDGEAMCWKECCTWSDMGLGLNPPADTYSAFGQVNLALTAPHGLGLKNEADYNYLQR